MSDVLFGMAIIGAIIGGVAAFVALPFLSAIGWVIIIDYFTGGPHR